MEDTGINFVKVVIFITVAWGYVLFLRFLVSKVMQIQNRERSSEEIAAEKEVLDIDK